MTFWAWADHHAGMTLFLLTLIVMCAATLLRRCLSTLKIIARGWPPAHLDGDGDAIKSTTTINHI